VRLSDFLASVMVSLLRLLFGQNGFGPCNAATGDLHLRGVVKLLRGFLHAHIEMRFLQFLDFGLQASDVFLA